MTIFEDTSEAHGASDGELSEEELLQWQPVFPARKVQSGADSKAVGEQAAAAPAPANRLPQTAASPATMLQPAAAAAATSAAMATRPAHHFAASVNTGPPYTSQTATELQAVPLSSHVSLGPEPDPIQASLGMFAAVQLPTPHLSSASASLLPSTARPSLVSSSSLSRLPHAANAEPLQRQSSLLGASALYAEMPPPQLSLLPSLKSASLSSLLKQTAAASPSAPAPASLSASIDSDWLEADPHAHRCSISSWSSNASDAHVLRLSTAATASTSFTTDPVPALRPPQVAGTGNGVSGSSVDGLGVAPATLLDWQLLNTAELQSQTAALLSSLTMSLDLDQSATDAHGDRSLPQQSGTVAHAPGESRSLSITDSQPHGRLGDVDMLPPSSATGLGSLTLPTSETASLLSSAELWPLSGIKAAEAAAAADRAGQKPSDGAIGWHSRASSASSARLSSAGQASGVCLAIHMPTTSTCSENLQSCAQVFGEHFSNP